MNAVTQLFKGRGGIFCDTNVQNDGCHQLQMTLNTFVFINHQAERGVVYSENSKEPKTEP